MGPAKDALQKIPIGRLNALPYSTLCIACQREMEQYPNWARHSHGSWEKVYDVPPRHSKNKREDCALSDLDIDLPSNR